MRHLGKLTAVAVAALALVAPTAAQADPGINANTSDGWVEFVGRTTCSWANVTTNNNPPNTVTVDKDSVNVSCTNGYRGVVNQDLVITFDDAAGTASVAVADVTGGQFSFWCRYVKAPVSLNRTSGTREYTGSYTVPLHSSNAAWACSNPASVRVWVKFY